MNPEDVNLVEKAKKGDRAAFRQLLEGHYGMIYRVAYKFTGQAQDAEDIAQEVCLGLVHKLQSFRGGSQFSTWLYRIIVNACHDYRKKRSAHSAVEQGYLELEAHAQAEQHESKRKIAWLYRAIKALKPPLDETAMLVLSEELSHAEAGKVLGCTESTVSWRMHEARKQLTQLLEQEYAAG